MMPASLFTHCNSWCLNLLLNKVKILTRDSHQRPEPRKTPRTKIPADSALPLAPARPRPAKTAAKEKIVMGFVSVRRNVEVYIPAYRFIDFGMSSFSWGWLMSVFTPRTQRTAPEQPEPELPRDQHIRYNSQTEGGNKSIDRVSSGRAHTGKKPRPASMHQRAARAEHAYRPYGRGNHKTDEKTLAQNMHLVDQFFALSPSTSFTLSKNPLVIGVE